VAPRKAYQVLKQEVCPWTAVGKVLEVCNAPCILKISFIDFEKEKAYCNCYKRLKVSSSFNSLCVLAIFHLYHGEKKLYF